MSESYSGRKFGVLAAAALVTAIAFLFGLGCGSSDAVKPKPDDDLEGITEIEKDKDVDIIFADGDGLEENEDDAEIFDESATGKMIEVDREKNLGYCNLYKPATGEIVLRSTGTQTVTIFSATINLTTDLYNEWKLENPIDASASKQLRPGETYSLKVTLTLTRGCSSSAQLIIITDDTRGGTYSMITIQLRSECKGNTEIIVNGMDTEESPMPQPTMKFQNTQVHTQKSCQFLSLKNKPVQPDDNKLLTIRKVVLEDPNDVNFEIPNSSGSSILLGAAYQTNVQICFNPQQDGDLKNKVYVYHDADFCDYGESCQENEQGKYVVVDISGKGVIPQIQVIPSCALGQPINFGEVRVGVRTPMTITIKNIGQSILTIYKVGLASSSSASFGLNPNNMQNINMAPNTQQQFELVYTPLLTQTDLGILEIQSNSFKDSMLQCSVQGSGVVSSLSVDPSALDFEKVLVKDTKTKSFRIRNTGNATLTIRNVTFDNAEDYSLSAGDMQALPVVLINSQHHDFTVVYSPQKEENDASTAHVINDSVQNDLRIPLNGIGVAPHIVTTLWKDCPNGCSTCATEVDDFQGNVEFGDVRLGDTGLRCLRICNAGEAALKCTQMGFGPNTSSDFRYFPEALPELDPVSSGNGNNCRDVGLFYSPIMYPGPDKGAYFLICNVIEAALQKREFNLRGNGISPRINITPTADCGRPYNFGSMYKKATSEPVLFSITNTGTGLLTISDIKKEDFGDPDNFNLTCIYNNQRYAACNDVLPVSLVPYDAQHPDAVFYFELTYSPKGAIARHRDTITITNNDYGREKTTICVEGTGKECDVPFYELDGFGPESQCSGVPCKWCEYYCSNYPPSQEKCNGRDDDCDNVVDNGFPIGQECSGVGECPAGQFECDSAMTGVRCSTNPGGSAYRYHPDFCDGKDNDCDGSTDNGIYNYRGMPTSYKIGDPCFGIGDCGIGTLECKNLNELRCSTDPGGSKDASKPESCDGKDNDCNGLIDDGSFNYVGNLPDYSNDKFPIGYTCQAGGCGRGKFECKTTGDGRNGVMCDIEPGGSHYLGAIEYCDNIDNNCNGQMDEGYFMYEDSPGHVTPAQKGEFCDGKGVCGAGVLECNPRDPTRLICSTDIGGSAYVATVEICDSLDNDCDGSIDNGFSIGSPCQSKCLSTTSGKCDCGWGKLECKCSRESCGDPKTDRRWQDTICSADPGGSDYAGTGEKCDGIDNDCDGVIDNGYMIGLPCMGKGECGYGFIECATPYTTRCDVDHGGSHYQGRPEVCDGKDNDCDGLVDEDYLVGQPCNGIGECGSGVYECNGPNAARCSTDRNGTQHQDKPEVCDGKDNDCDGVNDNGFMIGQACDGVGECGAGTYECKNLSASICSTDPGGSQHQDVPEICDGKDNDCDGTVDEDFNVYGTDPRNCGGCNRVCNCPHGKGKCTAGVCSCTCDPGWYDLNNDGVAGPSSDGCECQADTNDAGDTCSQARQTNPFSLADTGNTAIIKAKLAPSSDIDWYTFYAYDTPDTSCDKFYVRVRFTGPGNPGDQFRFALLKSSCTESGDSVVCQEGTDFSYATDFSNTHAACMNGGGDGSSQRGECPCYAPTSNCAANNSYCKDTGCCNGQGSNCWPNLTNACCAASGGINMCTDNSATFYLKVFRKTGATATCDFYEIEVTNGVFSSH